MLVCDVNATTASTISSLAPPTTTALAWLEQKLVNGGKRSFITHWAERDFGQFHTMALGDVNGDGKDDLVTGKRLFAHHGRDTSCYEPLFAFWYDLKGGQFERHILSFGHMQWIQGEETHNPPPNGAIAVGMKVIVIDMDKDGDNDIVAPGKTGPLRLLQHRHRSTTTTQTPTTQRRNLSLMGQMVQPTLSNSHCLPTP